MFRLSMFILFLLSGWRSIPPAQRGPPQTNNKLRISIAPYVVFLSKAAAHLISIQNEREMVGACQFVLADPLLVARYTLFSRNLQVCKTGYRTERPRVRRFAGLESLELVRPGFSGAENSIRICKPTDRSLNTPPAPIPCGRNAERH